MPKGKAAAPPDPTKLKRSSPGSYASADGRFTVEQASGRWLVLDAEQHDDLGMPLVRGPFATLDEARAAAAAARSGPAPTSDLAARLAAGPTHRPAGTKRAIPGKPAAAGAKAAGARRAATPAVERRAAKPVPIELRTYRKGDGESLRTFWRDLGFRSLGDDEDGLALLAARNPGLLIVATQGDRIIGTVLGAWDGRRGWLYHVGTAADHRRAGLGRRLVHEIERRLRALGCPKVNVIVRDDARDAPGFWKAMGYGLAPARQYGKEI
jgi:ribosomal protein S18 acetylase RimI-like enzyme